ncbi:aldehyde ferredoxin oxidoreductase family protein [Desulfatiferula olefinivorans]
MNGWCGRILIIDLDTKSWAFETPEPSVYHTWIGGRGLAGRYLNDQVTRNWDDPAMPLLFFTGPLVGTASPTSGRMTVMSRSPLTGAVGDASVGGALGVMMKKAGIDGVIIRGRSDTLCGIEISADGPVFVDARPLAGYSVGATFDRLSPRAASAVIGPAAEHGVLFSSIIVDRHFAAGRTGIGLVMASKNIKYLSVRGRGRIPVYDAEALSRAREDIVRLVSASPALSGPFGLSRFGTGALYDLMDSRRMMPTDNFRKTRFDPAKTMNAVTFNAAYAPKSKGCRGCAIQCKKVAQDGRAMPEFETLSHFSALLSNTDKETVMAANQLCNDLGMDTISAAATLSCFAEIQGRTLSPGEILTLLEDIGRGRGDGRALGQGSARYARSMGRPETSISVKSQELSAYDPRGALGMALSFAVSTRGACHLRAYPISHEILRKPVATDRFSFAGKARMIKIGEDINAAADSLTACKFIFFAATLEEYARVFEAVTGLAATGQDLLAVGARICKNERAMNRANGFTDADDDLPRRFFTEPGTSGPGVTVNPIDRDAFLRARAAYYKIRGE